MAKNLHYSCKPENIMKSLSDGGFKIIKADNKLSWKEKIPLNMFMVTFDNSEDIDKIYCGRFPWKAPTSPPPRRLMIRG
jgi:hypothetical protein